ncbi:potassium channel protein [soil metagenome]
MKLYSTELHILFKNQDAKTKLLKLAKFLVGVIAIFLLFGLIFQYIMFLEGQQYTLIDGFYWTLVTMSTLGYGDIVFTSTTGRVFSMIVLMSGVLFLIVLLPFTFIEFFYAPWLNAQQEAKAPKKLPPKTKNHVIITHLDAVTQALIKKLRAYKMPYAIIEPDLMRAIELSDQGYNVVNSDFDDFESYEHLCVKNASLVVASGNDRVNTNIAFTVREFNPDVKIVATATSSDSVDILELAGATHVIQMGEILGRSLARRTIGGNARVHVIGHIDNLVIGEAIAQGTPLIGKSLIESKLREKIGVSVVGIWERGVFSQPLPDTVIKEETVLVLAGTVEQLRKYDDVMSIYHVSDKPVVIIGAGRVGRSAAKSLKERDIDYRIIDKNPERIRDPQKYILGDAADLKVLEKAGLREAHTALITTHDDDINIYLTIYCRQLCPKMEIISRATYEKNISTLHRAGADFVMSYASMGANSIFNILEGQDVLMLAEGLNIFNHKVGKYLAGKSLIESDIRKETGCTVIAMKQDGVMVVNPSPDSVLTKDQEIILIGKFESESKFKEIYVDSV